MQRFATMMLMINRRRFGRYQSQSQPLFSKLINFLPRLIFFGLIFGTIATIALFLWYSRDLPDPNAIQRQEGFSTQILDRDSTEVLFDIFENKNRQFTPIDKIPQDLEHATVAVEDKDFYRHQGFDFLGMLRGFSRLFTRGRAQGGSTLTQQLVKNVLLTNERSLPRKIRELVLAVEIERKFNKDEILQMYLNEAPYGGTAWGIAAAAETYFDKSPDELSLVESVILAGMPQAPSLYSPYGNNPLAYVARATAVARRMREDGYISTDQEKDIVAQLPGVKFQPTTSSIKAPHFVMYVKEQLIDLWGEDVVERGGLKVTTSLNWDLQSKAENIIADEIDKVAGPMHITNGASMILDTNTGEILSMVGSRNFFATDNDGQVNVNLSLRQPGSSIKPVTYATAFAKGYWPGKVIVDAVTEFPSGDPEKPYKPEDYDGKEHGPVHLREALGSSLNIPAVKLLAVVGLKDMLATAEKMGFSSLAPTAENISRFGLSVTLGGGEVRLIDMVSAYSSFANGGSKVEPVSILKVEDSKGNVIYEHKQPGSRRILDEKVAFLINSILSDNNARLISFGPNSLLNFSGRSVAVKTGTTNDKRDNWAIGWTRDTIVGVWVGNNDNSEMKAVASGVSGASPIWRKEMLDVLSIRPDKEFTPPPGVEQYDLDKISGYPAHDNFPSYKEWAIKGTLPSEPDPIHRFVEVCPTDPSRRASDVMIAQGNFGTKEFVVLREDDPLTADNLWQKAIDQYISSSNNSVYQVPTETCQAVSGVHVEILNPKDRSRVDSNQVNVRAAIISDKHIDWVDLYLNDNKELRWDNPPYEKTYNLDNGVYKIRVVAHNSDGVESDRIHQFGVNTDWDSGASAPTVNP